MNAPRERTWATEETIMSTQPHSEKLNEIDLPSADTLDTGGWGETSGYSLELYLVPAGERDCDRPAVTTFSRIGSGTPAMAWHGRWLHVASVRPQTVGESVRRVLESIADTLVEVSDAYRGTEWDGHNHVGTWANDRGDLSAALGLAFEQYELSHYWTASDWYGGAGYPSDDRRTWERLCSDAEVDPTRVYADAWEEVVAEVVAHEEAQTDEHVSGIDDYVRGCAEAARERTEDLWWSWHDADSSRWFQTDEEAEEACAAWVEGRSDVGPHAVRVETTEGAA